MNVPIARFKNFDKKFRKAFGAGYQGSTDPAFLTKDVELTDDFDALLKAVLEQPAVLAYWSNQLRLAKAKREDLEYRLKMYKASKARIVSEKLKLQGIPSPTVKLIDDSFPKFFGREDVYKKYVTEIERWRRRVDLLSIQVEAIRDRKFTLQAALKALADTIGGGLGYVTDKNRKIKE
jgi:hypothetical protein